ncbi:phosphoglycerate dehydrogenase [Methylocaldum szegediense]|uniref:D-3-phosphoglycerate dehydrogenase n=1 Tax=Methylocaldum szegediense TaxID=73780 RepID=A0ABM9I5I2_9GAMM|nr:phosphoglycerate dehydrogenase [Methylocaldum szegediense]CAI8905756.1 2-oxoglutarate reductase [Methylocaldum szegediense]
MFKVLTYDNISIAGLERLPRDRYEVASEIQHPDAILLRSHNLHGVPIPESVKAVGRAGAGVNNIPVAEYSKRGVPVFNAPGANANAVKELVIAGMLLAARNICAAWDFARQLEGDDEVIHHQVEKHKKQFAGFELAGKTLGVLGLGAIGVKVANAAVALGMHVIGYDPLLTVESAWQLSSSVARAASIDDLIAKVDLLTLHVPLNDQTRHLVNAARIGIMKKGAVLLNFSRAGIVDDASVCNALNTGHLTAYVTDFPSRVMLKHPRAIVLPHIGASTAEAEENCAVFVADRIRDFLENGNIRHSVNFPDVVMPRTEGIRLGIANENVPNMVGQISSALADANLNILDLLNKSRGELAYTLIDLNSEVPPETLERIRAIKGVLSARVI